MALFPDIHIVYVTTKSKQLLFESKPITKCLVRQQVVYQYICPTCNASYIGRTKRIMYHCYKEHLDGFGWIASPKM